MQNLKRNLLVVSKLTWGTWRILTQALESLKKFHFNALLLSKVYIVWAKKYRGVIFNYIEEGCKIWRGIDFSFKNWHKEFDKFWPVYLNVSNMFTLLGSFWAKYIFFELIKYKGVVFHGIEEWCKNLKKNWLVVWKRAWGIWQIFTRALESVKIGTLIGSFCPK